MCTFDRSLGESASPLHLVWCMTLWVMYDFSYYLATALGCEEERLHLHVQRSQ